MFLVDDHALMRRGLREVLESADGIDVVGETGSAREAIRRIPAARPDVMLVDVRLPDGSGIDVCRRVRRVDPTIRALMITTYDDRDARAAAGAAGASGFLLKEVEVDDLVLAVRDVAHGHVLEGPTAAGEPARDPEVAAELIATLTRQERRVLALVAEGLTNQQIGRALGISPKTAKNHVTAILQKLNLRWRTQAAVSWTRATGGRDLSQLEHDAEPEQEHA